MDNKNLVNDDQLAGVNGGAIVGKTALFDVDNKGFVHFQDNYGGSLLIPKATFDKLTPLYAGSGEYTQRGMECRMKEVPVGDIQAIIRNNGF